jgi:hypothetical protein
MSTTTSSSPTGPVPPPGNPAPPRPMARRTPPRPARRRDLAAELGELTAQLWRLSAAHQRLREDIRFEAQALVDKGLLCRAGTNAALARLRLAPLDESEPTDALIFEVTVSLDVSARQPDQAHARARRIVMTDQHNLRDARRDDDPTICVLGPRGSAGSAGSGPTQFEVEADLQLTIVTECDNGPVPWANARRRLLADLARLRQVHPRLDEIRQVDAQCRGDLPDPDEDDPDDYDDEEYEVLY